MPLEQDLKKMLVDAMRAKDQKTLNVVRMISTKVMEKRTSEEFVKSGRAVDDAVYLEIIAAYMKSLQKAKEQFDAAGERGVEQSKELEWEIAFLDKLLPKKEVAPEVREAITAAIASTGVKDPKLAGRVVGEVMKLHKGKVDAADVRRVVEEELKKGGA